MGYKLTRDGMIVRLSDAAFIPADALNADYQKYLAWVAAGNAAQAADPLPDGGPSRDERLLAAVDSAKAAVAKSKVFTSAQAAVLSAVFDGLGKAITGEAP